MLRLGKERKTLNVVDDQAGSPTYARDLAAAIMSIADHLNQKESGWGTYHFCNQGIVNWHAFAKRIFELAREYDKFPVSQINPIPTNQYPAPAQRPMYSVLDCSSLENTFAIQRRSWEPALAEMLALLYR
jgi:dTDP-4-dehydrorhamnose reductase